MELFKGESYGTIKFEKLKELKDLKKINRRNLQRNFVPVQRLYFRNILESVPFVS